MVAAARSTAPKPLLRGVSHQIAFFVAIVATGVLVATARAGAPTWAALVFGASMVNLFGTSALYHRITWSDVARQRMRRLDHSAIFVLIAGGYTPLLALVPSAHGGHGALWFVWIAAALGIAKSLAWPGAPKWVTALLCLGIGWIGAGEVIARAAIVGWPIFSMQLASGLVYTAGAVVYATKRPDPVPHVFGYHEVFHALVIVASALLYAHVVMVLRVAG